MKISECSYCGVLAITDNDVCASCRVLISPEIQPADQNVFQPETDGFQQAPQAGLSPAYSAPNNEYIPQSPPTQRSFPGSYQSTQPALDSECLRCRTPLPRGQRKCFDCQTKKSSPVKRLAVLAIFVAVIGFFSFDYVYEKVSPHGIFRKYAKTTGADDSLIYENFTLKGDTGVSAFSSPSLNLSLISESKSAAENFSFKMVFKKPNKSSIEFTRNDGAGGGSYTAFKQAFDGVRGWKYTNMPNQPKGYQDTDDAFASKKMGLGMDEYDSLEFLNDAIAEEYGKENIKALTGIQAVEVADINKTSEEKTVVLSKQNRNGRIESALLVFDKKTGLLMGIIKKSMIGSTPLVTTIYFNKYAKFPVKRNGLFGVEETRILVPTKMSFVTKSGDSAQINGMPIVVIDLTVKQVEIDAPVEDSYFQKQQ